MGEAVLVTSGKGGSGKSTFSVNCGAAMAKSGRKVLLIDGDAGLRALDLMLSVSGQVIYDLADVLDGRCEPFRAILNTALPGLDLMPAPLSAADAPDDPETIRRLCRGLAKSYDAVLIDSPAGIGRALAVLTAAADRAVVVSMPDPVSVRDADRVASVLQAQGLSDIRLVLNRVRPKMVRRRAAYDLDTAIDAAAIRLIGVVPEDERLTKAAFRGAPALTLGSSPAVTAFSNIAQRLLGADVPLMKL